MKKTHRKKLTLERTTIRALVDYEANIARGGQLPDVSVGTCTGCRETYNPSCPITCRWTEQIGCP